MSSVDLKPGLQLGPYPEKTSDKPGWLERNRSIATLQWSRHIAYRQSKLQKIVKMIDSHGSALSNMNQADITQFTSAIRQDLHRDGLTQPHLIKAFALIREQSERTLGLRHFPTQLIGGWIMANGMLAEMQTGEGKTLTATLPAAVAALAGIPVHLMTANDYLVARDATKLKPLYKALGISVAFVTQDMDQAIRRQAYQQDITYGTGKQIAFDYLRDRLLLAKKPGRLKLQLEKLHDESPRTERLLLRGLCFAIVDEADSILIDEARTPLLIAQQSQNEDLSQLNQQALELASRLQEGIHFDIDQSLRQIRLSSAALKIINNVSSHLKGAWHGKQRREELITQALSALHLFQRDHHYLLKDDKVQIIDETTGRLMPERSWERGLHQMIESKEGCNNSASNETLARLSFQRFFRRYLRLSGMTGTAKEVAAELSAVYDLHTIEVPTRLPSKRKQLGNTVYRCNTARWQAVLTAIERQHKTERPILVATRSVASSEQLSKLLQQAGLKHALLNARQDQYEANIVANAGQPGQITIATNMAGRGTDIPLSDAARQVGGLHVIAAERNESYRIDRQLFGRAARQGDPGSYESICALDDELFSTHLADWLKQQYADNSDAAIPTNLGRLFLWLAQKRAASLSRQARDDLLNLDTQLADTLAFAGRAE